MCHNPPRKIWRMLTRSWKCQNEITAHAYERSQKHFKVNLISATGSAHQELSEICYICLTTPDILRHLSSLQFSVGSPETETCRPINLQEKQKTLQQFVCLPLKSVSGWSFPLSFDLFCLYVCLNVTQIRWGETVFCFVFIKLGFFLFFFKGLTSSTFVQPTGRNVHNRSVENTQRKSRSIVGLIWFDLIWFQG